VRICGRDLSTHQIMWKSEKLFVDVRTDTPEFQSTRSSHDPETGARKLAPVSGACVIGIIKESYYSRSRSSPSAAPLITTY